jgi:hypothetical protein
MPASPRILLIIIALLEGLVGLLLIVAPAKVIEGSLPGVMPGIDGTSMAHLAGTALVSLAALAWLARNATDSATLRPALGALLVYNVLAVVNLFYQALTIAPGSLAPGIVHLILTAALFFYWRKTA